MKKILFLSLLGLAPQPAVAQQCDGYVGQSVNALTFADALDSLPNIAPKGEFETTAQYEARRAAQLGGRTGPLIVLKSPEDRDRFIRYNADTARFEIQSYAFDNTGFDAWRALYGTPYAATLNPSTMSNFDVVVSETETPTGTYESQNSYGAEATVTQLRRTVEAIFDRPRSQRDSISASLFPTADERPYVAGYIDMAPAAAQAAKPLLQLAFVVSPREPFVITNEYSGPGRVTIQNPYDVTYNATILVGDIQCGLVLDSQNTVLGAFVTR